jgi:mono/diheme cytochrome c family protein
VSALAFLASPTRFVSIAVSVVGLVLAMACESSPRFTEPMVLGGQTVPPEVLERGARAYTLFCVSCHGADGSGRGNASRSFETPPRDFREADFEYVSGPPGSLPSDADLEETIRRGRPGTGMPAWDGLSAEDLHAVIQYIKTFSPRWRAEAPPAGEVSPP